MTTQTEISFKKYEERGACHVRESRRSVFQFNAAQQARFDLVLDVLGDIKGRTVLDIGCGDGALTRFFCERGARVIGVDNQELGLKFAREFLARLGLQAELFLAEAYRMPVADGAVDFAIASDVVEHVREPERMIREAARALRPGGTLVITTPYRLTEEPMDPFHCREFYPDELRRLLEKDFREIEIIEFQPAFWFLLYGRELKIPILKRFHKGRNILRYLVNLFVLCGGRNPLMGRNEPVSKKRRDFYTQIMAKARK